MNNSASILTQVNAFILEENLCLSKIAKKTEINAGTLSSIFNKNKIFTVDQLDRVTAVMNLPEGYFYEQYIIDYLKEATPNWRRIRPFLYRCAALDKLDCVEKLVSLLMENLMYAPLLFDVAEDLFQTQKFAAARLLYESVADSEKQQHSERLALCQYRLFLIRRGNDQIKNQHAAIQFEPYLERLDESDQLEALKDLANIYRSLRDWDKLEVIAKRLEEKAKLYYFSERRPEKKGSCKQTIRPAFAYYAFAFLLQGEVCIERQEHVLALQYISVYNDLSWVKETDEDTLNMKSLFQEWAMANTYVNKLYSGDISILPEYISYIETREDEMLLGFMNIVEAANLNNHNIDHFLGRFKSKITFYIQNEGPNFLYPTANIFIQTLTLTNELADYYLRNGNYLEGYSNLLLCLEKSSKYFDRSCIIKCVGLFERYKEKAPYEIKKTYQKLISEVYENEKKISVTPAYN